MNGLCSHPPQWLELPFYPLLIRLVKQSDTPTCDFRSSRLESGHHLLPHRRPFEVTRGRPTSRENRGRPVTREMKGKPVSQNVVPPPGILKKPRLNEAPRPAHAPKRVTSRTRCSSSSQIKQAEVEPVRLPQCRLVKYQRSSARADATSTEDARTSDIC
jgi:hypothetical protein